MNNRVVVDIDHLELLSNELRDNAAELRGHASRSRPSTADYGTLPAGTAAALADRDTAAAVGEAVSGLADEYESLADRLAETVRVHRTASEDSAKLAEQALRITDDG